MCCSAEDERMNKEEDEMTRSWFGVRWKRMRGRGREQLNHLVAGVTPIMQLRNLQLLGADWLKKIPCFSLLKQQRTREERDYYGRMNICFPNDRCLLPKVEDPGRPELRRSEPLGSRGRSP